MPGEEKAAPLQPSCNAHNTREFFHFYASFSMANLSVNINKIATLRNARGGEEPDLISFAEKILSCGVAGLTAHPRADQRHITSGDIAALHQKFSRHPLQPELNWEGDVREDFLHLTDAHPPHQCTLVPVSFGERTSHRGYDVSSSAYLLEAVVQHLKDKGVRVSVFVECGDMKSLEKASEIGFHRIEIYTAPYAHAFSSGSYATQLTALKNTARRAVELGLGVNAGHDLNFLNIPPLLQAAPEIQELSVGHHLISYALEVGIEAATQRYLESMRAS